MRIDDYIDAAIRSTKLSTTQQAVLWRIGRYANHRTGEAWPSLQTLADDCHITRDNVWRAVVALVTAGVIVRHLRPGRSSILRFPTHPAIHTHRADAVPPTAPARHPPTAEARRTYRGDSANPPRQRGPNSYEPVLEPAPRCPQCDERHNVGARCPAEWTVAR